MNIDILKEFTRELTAIPGIASYEQNVRNYILDVLKQTRAKININFMGCVIAVFEGTDKHKKPLLLDAHMDEIGFIVQHIEDNGFLRILNYGGIDPRVALGQRFDVHSNNNKIYSGVSGLLPPHVLEKNQHANFVLEQLFVDCGFRNSNDVLEADIRVGSQVTFKHSFYELKNDFFCSKAIDDRAGCAVLLAAAKDLDKTITERTIVFSFSTQEETGTRGISTVLEQVKPEYALVVEATTACDTPNISGIKVISKIESGPVFTVADKSICIDPFLLQKQIDIAKQNNIKYQIKTPGFGGTNARKIHNNSLGIKTSIVALPTRYLHSPLSVASWQDLFLLYNFVSEYIKVI